MRRLRDGASDTGDNYALFFFIYVFDLIYYECCAVVRIYLRKHLNIFEYVFVCIVETGFMTFFSIYTKVKCKNGIAEFRLLFRNCIICL